MSPPEVRLGYSISGPAQDGAGLDSGLFEVLAAVQEHGSILHAAQALQRSYRHTWGELKRWEAFLDQPLLDWNRGQRARLTPYAQRLLWAERQARVRMTPHLEAMRSQLRHVFAQAEDPRVQVLDVFASHDLALPCLQAMAARERLHLNLQFAGSAECLRALGDGRCNVAGFHVPRLAERSEVFARALRDSLQPGEHKLIGSHRRTQGLMFRRPVSREVVLTGLADLVDSTWRLVNRQPGSGTRLLMDHLVQQAGFDAARIDGYHTRTETTHVAVAAAVAAGIGDVGLGIEAAAREFGLDFLPIVEEDYYLVCLQSALDTAAVRHLRDLLSAPRWAAAVGALPGCLAHEAGNVLSLTRALKWWELAPKRKRASLELTRSGRG